VAHLTGLLFKLLQLFDENFFKIRALLRNNPKERRSRQPHGGSLKSRTQLRYVATVVTHDSETDHSQLADAVSCDFNT
jgi:hypothetical protein